MKRAVVIFLIFIFLFLGIMIGSNSSSLDNSKLSEELKDFEGQITLPNNDYHGRDVQEVVPNIFAKIGKKVEVIIDKTFGATKGVIKKIID